MLSELLKEIVTALEIRAIPYMISGSYALSAYTVPRMTRDIDIVIELDETYLKSFLSIFDSNFYLHEPTVSEEVRKKGMFNVIDHRSGYKIDFVVKKNSPYRKLEFERRTRSNVLGFDAWLVSLEDLVISKIIWIQDIQSERQINDIKSLLENDKINRDYLLKWIKELNLNTFNLI